MPVETYTWRECDVGRRPLSCIDVTYVTVAVIVVDSKNLVVCHVNYNVRESALRDELIVREYCERNNIKLEVLKDIKSQIYLNNIKIRKVNQTINRCNKELARLDTLTVEEIKSELLSRINVKNLNLDERNNSLIAYLYNDGDTRKKIEFLLWLVDYFDPSYGNGDRLFVEAGLSILAAAQAVDLEGFSVAERGMLCLFIFGFSELAFYGIKQEYNDKILN